MRLIAQLVMILCFIPIFASPAGFGDFQRDLGRQAAAFQGSEAHRILHDSRDTRDYSVGDTRTFWRWNLSVMPPTWIQSAATCRAVGEHCYLFVADDQWDSHMTQTDVDTVMPYLEEHTMTSELYGAVEMDTTLFGAIPDELDNDPRLIVFYSALGSFNGSQFDGYFSAYNQVTEEEAQQMNPSGHSNECEMIYMTCYPLAPDDPIRISVLSHELQHLIHWGQDPNEDTWVDEGCAELAMVLFGEPDPIQNFPTNPDNSLIVWDQEFADYVKTMLFFTYLYEHHDQGDLIRRIVAEPQNGIGGIENQLGGTAFSEVFADWTAANYLDDLDYADGIYNYDLLDLPAFHTTTTPVLHTFEHQNGSGTVQPWACDYLRIPINGGGAFYVQIDTEQSLTLRYVFYNDDGQPATGYDETVTTWGNSTNLSGLLGYYNPGCSEVVVMIANTDATAMSYTYNMELAEVSTDDHPMPSTPLLTVGPNPFRPGAAVFAVKSGSVLDPASKLTVCNLRGEVVRVLNPTGDRFSWDGRDFRGTPVGTGIYLYRAEIPGLTPVVGRTLVVR